MPKIQLLKPILYFTDIAGIAGLPDDIRQWKEWFVFLGRGPISWVFIIVSTSGLILLYREEISEWLAGVYLFGHAKKAKVLEMMEYVIRNVTITNLALEDGIRIGIYCDKLSKMNLAPPDNFWPEETNDRLKWLAYLEFIKPHVEIYGTRKAKKMTKEMESYANAKISAFEPPNLSVKEESNSRIYTNRTASEIFKTVRAEGMTQVDVDNYTQPHIGKWIRIQSVIRGISQDDKFYNVLLGKWLDPIPCLTFSKDTWGKHIETMTQGDRIAAEGRITGISRMEMYIDCCEIVELRDEDDLFL